MKSKKLSRKATLVLGITLCIILIIVVIFLIYISNRKILIFEDDFNSGWR